MHQQMGRSPRGGALYEFREQGVPCCRRVKTARGVIAVREGRGSEKERGCALEQLRDGILLGPRRMELFYPSGKKIIGRRTDGVWHCLLLERGVLIEE